MKLNHAQNQAAQAIEGPVMVIAGPGTGKTEIIAQRIANILKKTDTSPESILALTFTESGAKSMRQRLIQTIGQTAYYVNISTFHSFCSSVIKEFPDHFIISLEMEPLGDLEKLEIIHKIIDTHQFKYLKPINSIYYYAPTIIHSIQDLKREGVSPKSLKKILSQEKIHLDQSKDELSKSTYNNLTKDLQKNLELLLIYQQYQKDIRQLGRFDFEDMINLVVDAFSQDELLLRTYQEKYHYFLIDEYQDTNSSQNQVINLLASFWGEQANVFVVGDSNQSIYRFQGASLENITSFKKTYPNAQIITLDQNYRSTQTILDSSLSLIKNNSPEVTKLTSQKKSTSKVNLVRLPSGSLETFWIANKVKDLINNGIDPQDVAVLVRHNSDLADLTDIFSKLSISFDIEGGNDILEDPDINQMLTLLRVINTTKENFEDDDLFTLFHYSFLGLDSLDVLKLSRAASKKKISIVDLILSDKFTTLNLSHPEKFTQLITSLAHFQQLDSQLTFPHFFETLLKQSGYLDWLMSQDNLVKKLNTLNSLFIEIKRLSALNHQLRLKHFLEIIQIMKLNRLKITAQDQDILDNRVTLTTAHKAKGKEWAHVFVYRCVDKKWGNNLVRQLIKLPSRILQNSDLSKVVKNQEERRLFYVAITRAKTNLYLSFADRYSFEGRAREAIPSMFIQELNPSHLKNISTKTINSKSQIILQKNLTPPQSSANIDQDEKAFLTSLISSFKLSATALNNYLTCPYKFKLNNLIKVPRSKQPYLSYGTAIHKALEIFYKKYSIQRKLPSLIYLLQSFETSLKKEVMTKDDYLARLEQGRATLKEYFNHYQDSFKQPLHIEKYFGLSWSKPILDDIPLSGKIDRIDLVSKSDKTIKVVDYKTGSAKTKNQILGNTKDSSGDLFRQLVFYQLLVQLDKNFDYKVLEAELDFIEPDKTTKKFRRESFSVTQEQTQDLKKIIKNTMKEIRSLNFNRTKDYQQCQRCEYQNHCWPKGTPSYKETTT